MRPRRPKQYCLQLKTVIYLSYHDLRRFKNELVKKNSQKVLNRPSRRKT